MRGFVVGSMTLIVLYVVLTRTDKAVAANNALAVGFRRVFGREAGDVAAIPDKTGSASKKPTAAPTTGGNPLQLLTGG